MIFFVAATNFSYAQKIGQARIDSLLSQLQISKEDTAKVVLLVRIGNNYKRLNSPNAGHYYHQGIALAEKLRVSKYIYLTYEAMRSLSFANKDYPAVERYISRSQAIADVDLRCKFLLSAGYDYYLEGDYVRAQRCYMKAYKLPHLSTKNTAMVDFYIGSTYYSKGDTLAIRYYAAALAGFTKVNDRSFMRRINQNIGGLYLSLKRDLKTAMQYYQQAVALSRNLPEDNSSAGLNQSLASVYQAIGDTLRALTYYAEALRTVKKIGDSKSTLLLLDQISLLHYQQKSYNRALEESLEALKLSANNATKEQLDNRYNTIAWIYYAKKDYTNALTYLQKALPSKNIGVLGTLGSIYREAPDGVLAEAGVDPAHRYSLALYNLEESMRLAANTKEATPYFYQEAYQELSMTFEKMKDYPRAYAAFSRYVSIKDSLARVNNNKEYIKIVAESKHFHTEDSLKLQQQIAKAKLDRQTLIATQQQQALLLNRQQLSLVSKEKDLQKLNYLKTQAFLELEQGKRKAREQELNTARQAQKLSETRLLLQKSELSAQQTKGKLFMAGIGGLILLSLVIGKSYINQRRSNRLLTKANAEISEANARISFEQQRSENLLLNILPADVAEELKEKGSANARLFDEVTVLFTDFVNFTTLSQQLTPEELVAELHFCFMAFDKIISNYSIEKIKTIGDAYLAVGGLPSPDNLHAENVVRAALEIAAFVRQRKASLGDKTFDIRIGIHSGSVVAGIVGVKKFAYDIWGDTVNTAARMEQNSMPGKINVSETTYRLVRDSFTFTYRGKIEAKNKGSLDMYFLDQSEVFDGNLTANPSVVFDAVTFE
ncbi:adenylate/guanylate cyclase domain-containing protein [uncultured Mucilaginibacter sp.]|uniref:adenylate/guanylate cyclase domain-containing protein n=1 Tax=uncultured Mucilaginibacter sp. TaxID=797541 RepID=UPI0025D8A44B|nr:adenylate/guanylate cyclase domain-containing protein [uncultured Mucilaginibacter sp.]